MPTERTPVEHHKVAITISTTHIDRHGQRMALQALEGLVEQINQRPIPMHWEHDVTSPPIGRTTRAWLERLDDGEYAVRAEAEVFKGVWAIKVNDRNIARAGRSRTLPPAGQGELSIGFDPLNYDEADIKEVVSAAAEVGEVSGEHRLRKAMLPPPDLVIYMVAAAAPFLVRKRLLHACGREGGRTGWRRPSAGLQAVQGTHCSRLE